MSKKARIIVISLVLLVLGITGASAGDGLRLGLEFGNPLAVIIIRPDPLDFKVGYNFDQNNPNIFLSADLRIISGYRLIDFLHMFLGLGAYTDIYLDGRDNAITLGARIPFGLQAFLFDRILELFVELAPTISFFPALQFNNVQGWHGYAGFTFQVPKF